MMLVAETKKQDQEFFPTRASLLCAAAMKYITEAWKIHM